MGVTFYRLKLPFYLIFRSFFQQSLYFQYKSSLKTFSISMDYQIITVYLRKKVAQKQGQSRRSFYFYKRYRKLNGKML